jgi:DNA helicase-2/ATP-dependent DNA helicase PcrA
MFELNSLNPQQQAAVTHRDGPLLLLAGAGSGKTRVITCRIVQLLQNGVRPEHILAVTFTNKAAREMRERVQEMVGRKAGKGMVIATFHALCVRLLKEHIDRLGFKKNFSIYGAADQQRLIRTLLQELSNESSAKDADQVLWRISAAKNQCLTPEHYQGNERDPFSLVAAHIYPRYQKSLKAFNAVDFDDLLLFCVRLFDENPDLLEQYRERFKYQMVDEYQDTNPVQYRLLQQLAGGHNNLCVVGDDDQSIYAFRGADVSNILSFEKDFPGTKMIKLEQNYRSSGNILACANAVIRHNKTRREKALWSADGDGADVEYLLCEDSEDEARVVMERIHTEMARGTYQYGDFAILYRTNTQSRSFEEQLNYEDIPFVLIGGQQFFERKEVKDVIAYLKVIDNPNDEVSLLRILNYPKRGIGESSIDRIIRYSAEHNISLWKLLHHPEQVGDLNEKTCAGIFEFIDLIRRYRTRFSKSLPMVETLTQLINELKLAEEIYRQEKNPQVAKRRVENQEEILNSMAYYLEQYDLPSLSGFIQRVSLNDDDRPGKKDKESKLERNAVTLMSLHSSKGLEFPVVFLVGMEEGYLPHKKSIYETFDIDEERRLCYVGITRAQRQLVLLGARRRRKYGKMEQREPSRFLAEMPKDRLVVRDREAVESTPEQQEQSASNFFSNMSKMLSDS